MAGLERISEQCRSIGQESEIVEMPPVEIIPELWGTDDSTIDGMALSWPPQVCIRPGFPVWIWVQVPAQTALCENLKAVRAVLVHEFLHCFHAIETHDRVVPGEPIRQSEDFNLHSPEHDAAALANPFEWLGEQDAGSLIHHGTAPIDDPIQETFLRYIGHFRQVTPSRPSSPPGAPTHAHFVGFQTAALKRARELNAARAVNATGRKAE